jgi:hypothetical protein
MDEGRRRESATPVGVWWREMVVEERGFNLSEIEGVDRERVFFSNEDKKFV